MFKIKVKNQFDDILIIYKKMNLNEITINYKIDKNEDIIKLFGYNFVKNNKQACNLIIEGQ